MADFLKEVLEIKKLIVYIFFVFFYSAHDTEVDDGHSKIQPDIFCSTSTKCRQRATETLLYLSLGS